MWDVCLKILLALLMIVGLTDVFRMLCNWFLKTRVKGKIVYLLPLSGHSEEAEIALRGAVHRLRWFSGKEEKRLSAWTAAWIRKQRRFAAKPRKCCGEPASAAGKRL